jgi:histidinol-phosphate aminotransferase
MAEPFDILSHVQPHFLDLDAYEAVDPPEVLAERAGIPESQVVKLNGNENPYGPSPRVMEALANLDRVHIYPDPQQVALREAIGHYMDVAPEYIVAGNGSDEIIDLLFRALLGPGAGVVNCTPTFGMYSFTAHVVGAKAIEVPRNDEFQIDVPKVIKTALTSSKIVVLASPNNPTGNSVPVADIQRLLDAGLLVILDEAYGEFGGESVVQMVASHSNLVVLRTFSKWAGLAGLRVGYGVMAPALAEVIMRAKPPYNVSQAAEAAVLASLDDLPYIRERVSWMVREKQRLYGLLNDVSGLDACPSDANFILCRTPENRGQRVYEALARRGVFVRYFSNPRLRDYVRISVGTPEETDRLMDALYEALKE